MGVFKPVDDGSKLRLVRLAAMTQNHDKAYNRDQDQKPGSPQRMAQEPGGSEGSARTSKTATDPASGEDRGRPPAPNQARTDQTDGAEPGRGR